MNATKPYSYNLRWRIVWAYYRPTYHLTQKEISDQFHVSEQTVHRYLQLFRQTGDVEIRHRRDGPEKLLGNFEQLTLLRLVLIQPGLYLHELQEMLNDDYGVVISIPTICRALKQMGCTRQSMHHVALQQSNYLRAKFMAEVSCYDPSMLVWLDETGCDNRNALRQKAYSIRGMPLNNHQLLIRGVRYSAIPLISLDGIHDVHITEGTINGDRFADFVRNCLVPILNPFNRINTRSVVLMDNASIHHIDEVTDLVEAQANARLCFLPPYSPDLMPAEEVFSKVKTIIKEDTRLYQMTPRLVITMAFTLISQEDCRGFISHCGYI